MHDGHQVLPHLLLWRKPLLIEHPHFATVRLGVMLNPFKAEAGQSVSVGKNQRLDFSPPTRIGQFQEPLALEVQSAADFLHELDVRQAFRHHKLFQHLALVDQIWLLRRAGYATIGNQPCGLGHRLAQANEFADVRLGLQASVAVGSRHRD